MIATSFSFYGITCVQSYMYFKTSTHDRQWFRGVIFSLWILDTLHLALITHGLYYYLVSNFGNFAALVGPTWSILAQVYVTCINDLIVRCDLILISIFGRLTAKNYFIATAIATTSLLTFVFGFVFATRAFSGRTFAYFSKISVECSLWAIPSFAHDISSSISISP
ncbi:hypothetical protein DXG01_012997 [Tephrocybe rancida]|nr:hypothetical protein DXG01_012997 [Tephrocybe rancida]